MRRARCLTKVLPAHTGLLACFELQSAAPPISAAGRLYSSAASLIHLTRIAKSDDSLGPFRSTYFVSPGQQLTSLLTLPHARSFSSTDGSDVSSPAEAVTSLSSFDASAILDAIAGVEEDGWLAAREDVWFFNRYIQSVLRFVQEATGLPWYLCATVLSLLTSRNLRV